jgi:hypothetical protein
LLAECERQGFQVRQTARGHWQVFDPAGRRVTTLAGSPSDRRSWLNGLAALRRAGFVWQGR